jgi:hypothetical protein
MRPKRKRSQAGVDPQDPSRAVRCAACYPGWRLSVGTLGRRYARAPARASTASAPTASSEATRPAELKKAISQLSQFSKHARRHPIAR